MGTFDVDTAVTRVGDHRHAATLSERWRIWGPAGGYVAAIALRAAGAEATFGRPASASVQFLGVADFAEVELAVEVVKRTRRAECLRVTMHQGDRVVLVLTTWVVADDGMLDREHHFQDTCDFTSWDELPTTEERLRAEGVDPDDRPPNRFWENFDQRAVDWVTDWENRPALDPVWRSWMRFVDVPAGDPWLDACRLLLLADLGSWPAAQRAYDPAETDPWFAPSLDVHCHFVDVSASEWLAVQHVSPTARDGLVVSEARVWSDDGRLGATGITQLLATPMRPIADRR